MSGTLVRFWENGFQNEIATQWVDWEDGWFHLDPESQLAKHLTKTANVLVTVYSTEALIWTVSNFHVRWNYMTVHCVPWVEAMRHSLLSDEYMVHMWLQAEEQHRAAS